MTTAIQPTQYDNLDVALSTNGLEDVEKLLIMRNQPLEALWKSLRTTAGYDFILIDCAPSLGTLTRNAMRASEHLVIPTDLDSFSVDGMNRLGGRIAEMQEDYDETCAQVLGVLITKFDRTRSIENRANYTVLEGAFGGNEVFFERRIRIDELCRRAKREHRAVLDVRGSRAADDYRALAGEFLDRVA